MLLSPGLVNAVDFEALDADDDADLSFPHRGGPPNTTTNTNVGAAAANVNAMLEHSPPKKLLVCEAATCEDHDHDHSKDDENKDCNSLRLSMSCKALVESTKQTP